MANPKDVISLGNKDVIEEIRRYTIMGYSSKKIAKQLHLRLDEVGLAVSELKRLGLLSPDKARDEMEKVYNFQVTKTKNWAIESLSIAIKLFVSDLDNSKKNEVQISNLRQELKTTKKRLREIDKALASDDPLIKATTVMLNKEKEMLEDKLFDVDDDLSWMIKDRRRVNAKDLKHLSQGLTCLEDIEKNRTPGSTVNKNSLIVAGMSLKQARDIISNDPVMREAVETEFKNLSEPTVDDEFMEGFDDFKNGGNL